MEKLLKPTGSLNRREFLQTCGRVVVVSASYEAVSLVLGEATAHAESVNTHVPDEPLDALLPNAPILGNERQSEVISKSLSDDAERIKAEIRERLRRKLEPRVPAAICGVRG